MAPLPLPLAAALLTSSCRASCDGAGLTAAKTSVGSVLRPRTFSALTVACGGNGRNRRCRRRRWTIQRLKDINSIRTNQIQENDIPFRYVIIIIIIKIFTNRSVIISERSLVTILCLYVPLLPLLLRLSLRFHAPGALDADALPTLHLDGTPKPSLRFKGTALPMR